LTNFINNVVSSSKGILIADACIYICTTVCKFKEHPSPREPWGIGPSFSAEGYNPPKKESIIWKHPLLKKHKFCRKPFNEHSYHVRFQFAKWFQRRRLKSKILQTTDAK
jgi:hypothetical protein